MFYEPDKNNHGLPFNPSKSIVVARPIGWPLRIAASPVHLACKFHCTLALPGNAFD